MALNAQDPKTPGNQPDRSSFVAIHHWISQINRIRSE
jgi:hypothetical protein